VLGQIQEEAIMPPAVPLVTSIIETPRFYSRHVRRSAIETALRLLQSAHAAVRVTSELLRAYGTTNIQSIYEMTKGTITADKLPHIEFAAAPSPAHLTWTTKDIGTLMHALSLVSRHPELFSRPDVLKVKKALHMYANPFGTCVGYLNGGTHESVH